MGGYGTLIIIIIIVTPFEGPKDALHEGRTSSKQTKYIKKEKNGFSGGTVIHYQADSFTRYGYKTIFFCCITAHYT